MPADLPSPSGSPDPDKPDTPQEVTESDLWNLDEEMPAKAAAPPEPRESNRKARPESGSDGSPEVTQIKAKRQQSTPDRPKDAFPQQTVPQPQRPVEDEIGDLDDDMEEAGEPPILVVVPENEVTPPPSAEKEPEDTAAGPTPPIDEFDDGSADDGETGSSPEPAAGPRENRPKLPAGKPPWSSPGRQEIIGLGVFSFILLLIGIWVLSRFFTQLHFKSDNRDGPDFPVKGQHATLAKGETYWREPIREGDSRDVARREVVMIPVLDLTLDSSQSSLGALRVIFRDKAGQAVGDSLTRSFTAGRFDAAGGASISFPATDGFTDLGTFNGYRTETGDPWTVEVLEGPSVDASASNFKPLVQIPILPQQR